MRLNWRGLSWWGLSRRGLLRPVWEYVVYLGEGWEGYSLWVLERSFFLLERFRSWAPHLAPAVCFLCGLFLGRISPWEIPIPPRGIRNPERP